jgi:hypothetical protein
MWNLTNLPKKMSVPSTPIHPLRSHSNTCISTDNSQVIKPLSFKEINHQFKPIFPVLFKHNRKKLSEKEYPR